MDGMDGIFFGWLDDAEVLDLHPIHPIDPCSPVKSTVGGGGLRGGSRASG